MIHLIVGENSFENERTYERLVAEFNGAPEKLDGETLELKQLPDLLMGMSLFATKRLVVIKNLSLNKSLWEALELWLPRISDDIDVVLMETKPDKRTKTYKALQKIAKVHESKLWTERDTTLAEKWALEESDRLGRALDKKSAHALVAWVGVDQWGLFRALEKLVVFDEITPEIIKEVIEPNETENTFQLFEAALRGDSKKVVTMIRVLQKTEDPYRLFGLLGSQAFQLAALGVAGESDSTVAADLSVHPFVISKLRPAASRLGRQGTKEILLHFAEADADLKTSVADPWLLIERALLKTAKTTL